MPNPDETSLLSMRAARRRPVPVPLKRHHVWEPPWGQAAANTNQPPLVALLSPPRPKSTRRVWTNYIRYRHLNAAQPPALILPVVPLVVQHTTIPGTGIIPLYTSANVFGDTFVNVGGAELKVNNNSGVPVTVTVVAVNVCNQSFLHDLVLSIPAGTSGEIGPFDFHYTNLSTGVVTIHYSGVTQISVAVVAP